MDNNKIAEKCSFSSKELQEILGGYWYNADKVSTVFAADYFITGTGLVVSPKTCFVAMTYETWLKGSGNSPTGHYANVFSDSHVQLLKNHEKPNVQKNLVGIVAEHPIPELADKWPQLIVPNPYDAIKTLAALAREKVADNGTIIAVTGAVGKSTTVNMLNCLLQDKADYISNTNGHNSRTGVWMWLSAVGRFNPLFKKPDDKPNVCTIEVAEAALWTRSGGVCTAVKPHIGVITHNALTQYQKESQNIRDVAVALSRICNGVVPGGKAVLYRDMPDFDFIKDEVIKFGAIPVTYGESPECDTYVKKHEFVPPTAGDEIVDLTMAVEAVVLGEEVSYTIGAVGKPVVLNSLATLTTAKLAGFALDDIVPKFVDFRGNKNVMQLSNCNGVCVLDCSHNLEIPSIIAAFDLLSQIKQRPGTRKIVLLSRIVNWGDKAPELHMGLLEPISNAGFDRFFFHEPLDEYKYLAPKLPDEVNWEKYDTAEEIVKAFLGYVREGDSVLVMGAARGCDFGNVLPLLQSGLKRDKKTTLLLEQATSFAPYPPCTAYSLKKNKRLFENGDLSTSIKEGLSTVLILRVVLSLLLQGKFLLSDKIVIGKAAAAEKKVKNALSVAEGDNLDVKTLVEAYVSVNSPDAVISLAQYVLSKAGMKATEYYKEVCEELCIDINVAANVTGRVNKNYPDQCYTIDSLEKIAQFFFSLPLNAYLPLKSTTVTHNNKLLSTDSILHTVPNVISFYCFGYTTFSAIVHANVNNENVVISVCGAKSAFARDMAVCDMLSKLEKKPKKTKDEWIKIDDSRGFSGMTIAGDTYFGEWYTRQRKKLGQNDALQEHGYSYSFGKVAPLLPETDMNIVNFEAVLTENTASPFEGHYEFLLDAAPNETIAELKRRNVGAVILANNHSLDYGEFAAEQSRKLFIENGFHVCGVGKTLDDAERPICFECAGRQVIVFSAYWYRSPRHYVSRHYCMGNNTGTACIDDSLFNKIKAYREKYPKAFIIFSPHWGTDFNDTDKTQKRLAKLAVSAGVDCIIAHGPHIVSEYERIDGKFVLYSLGNFVFNHNGREFARKNKPPFAYVAKLHISKEDIELRLYPIFAANKQCFWQPYPVIEEQLEELFRTWPAKTDMVKKDEIGYYLEIGVV